MTTLNDSVYSMPIRSSLGWLKLFSPLVNVADGSRISIAAKSLRCLFGIFTILSDSELSISIKRGVVY